jgi:elongation factor P
MEIEDVRRNTKLLIDNVPYNVDELEFMKPGKGRAIYRLRLKNLNTGSTVDRTYHSSEKVEEVHASNQENQYLYQEGDHYVFMDTKTFEQHSVTEADLGSKKGFLKEGMVVSMLMMGDKAIDITLPTFVELRVVETAIATKTATITPQMKSAVTETGCTIAVPPFIKEGDVLKVDTRTGKYVERISTGK